MRNGSIGSIDFAQRRKVFLSKIKKGVAVFPSAPMVIRNNDVHHSYRQESNFYYLTGFDEAHSICLFAPESDHPFQMFVEPRNKVKELWEGKIIGPEGARAKFGADAAFANTPDSIFDEAFVAALLEAETLYYRVGLDAQWDQRIFRLLAIASSRKLGRTGRPLWPIIDPADILGEMRFLKSKAEIERLEQAANITAEAHINAMRLSKPGMYEYEVEAALFHSFRASGAERVGYGSIVASGSNACVLHYVANNRRMTDKDLLLVDAGAEYDYYTADITRVFPVGGMFSEEQSEVYGAVLKAQRECIRMTRPGKTMREIHACAVEVLTEELKRMKILKGPTAQLIKKKEYFAYYPHNTGHWLGMDVHDVGRYYAGTYDHARKLEPGAVFTIEPGLYFGPDAKVPAKYKGIGVRIEDDILVTSSGHKVLTAAAPKEIEEIESLCGNA
jgi:Xaa-Pro aminopeptidase